MAENTSNPNAQIKHLFVLMMENRSFDHMLGFSNITGVDAKRASPRLLTASPKRTAIVTAVSLIR